MEKTFGHDKPITSEKEWDEVFEKQCKIVAKTLKISIAEARRRTVALNESGLLILFSPLEPEGQKAIDIFLTNENWKDNPEKVLMSTKKELAFDSILEDCLFEQELVQNFDRLAGTNIWQTITGKINVDEKQFKNWINRFSKFVRDTVWARLTEESFK